MPQSRRRSIPSLPVDRRPSDHCSSCPGASAGWISAAARWSLRLAESAAMSSAQRPCVCALSCPVEAAVSPASPAADAAACKRRVCSRVKAVTAMLSETKRDDLEPPLESISLQPMLWQLIVTPHALKGPVLPVQQARFSHFAGHSDRLSAHPDELLPPAMHKQQPGMESRTHR